MKIKYLCSVIIILFFCSCTSSEPDYISIGKAAVVDLNEKINAINNMEFGYDNIIYDFSSKYPSEDFASQCSIKLNDTEITRYDELLSYLNQSCTEKYSQKILDEKALINYNNEIYYTPVDMLLDFYMYDYSKIISYSANNNCVIYYCEAYGIDEDGNPIDVLEYSFSIQSDGGIWKIADCSYNGYCNYKLLCNTLIE